MKLLLDQGLSRSAVDFLRAAGFDAEHTGNIDLARATDSEILNHARQENQVVITLDADFHSLLALSGAISPSVVRIRIEGLRGKALAVLLQQVLAENQDDLIRGAVLTIQPGRIRSRYLPLLPNILTE